MNISTVYKSILLVDDSSVARNLVSSALRARGYTVDIAKSGTQGISLIRKKKYDLVLLDIEMGGMNGIEALSQIRNIKGMEKLPVLMLSGSRNKKDIIDSSKLGAFGYILKDKNLNPLLNKVDEILS